MRWVIYFNEYWYPLSSIQWCFYAIIVAYMLFTGMLVFYLNPDMVCYAYMPYILMCGLINRAATRPVASMDSVAGAETCFSFAWANVAGFLSALFDRVTCKKQVTKQRTPCLLDVCLSSPRPRACTSKPFSDHRPLTEPSCFVQTSQLPSRPRSAGVRRVQSSRALQSCSCQMYSCSSR